MYYIFGIFSFSMLFPSIFFFRYIFFYAFVVDHHDYSFPYHPIDEEDGSIDNNYTKRNRIIKIIIIFVVCTVIVLSFLGIGIKFYTIFKQEKSKVTNSTTNETFTANTTSSPKISSKQVLTSTTGKI